MAGYAKWVTWNGHRRIMLWLPDGGYILLTPAVARGIIWSLQRTLMASPPTAQSGEQPHNDQ